MTDKAAALSCSGQLPGAAAYAEQALQQFEQQYRDEALVMNLWLQIQATQQSARWVAAGAGAVAAFGIYYEQPK